MTTPARRSRFFSEHRPSLPFSSQESFPMQKYFPESPQISLLQLPKDPIELTLDEPLSVKQKMSILNPMKLRFKPEKTSFFNCDKGVIHEEEEEIYEESNGIKENANFRKELFEVNEFQTNADEKEQEGSQEDRDFDQISMMCVMDEPQESLNVPRFNDFFRTSSKQLLVKRNDDRFLEEGKEDHQTTLSKEVCDLEIKKEVSRTKNLLDKLFEFQENSLQKAVMQTRRRCRSFHTFGGRQIFQFMQKKA